MFNGHFKFIVSTDAELLNYEFLPAEERNIMFAGINPSEYDAYRFFVEVVPTSESDSLFIEKLNTNMPWHIDDNLVTVLRRIEEIQVHVGYDKLSRKGKRKNFLSADMYSINMVAGSDNIQFSGCFPCTLSIDGQWELDLEVKSFVKIESKVAGFSIFAKARRIIKKKSFMIWMRRTNNFIHWVFLEKWIRSGGTNKLQFVCKVPKDLPQEKRFIRVSALVEDNGREILKLNPKKVSLPMPSILKPGLN